MPIHQHDSELPGEPAEHRSARELDAAALASIPREGIEFTPPLRPLIGRMKAMFGDFLPEVVLSAPKFLPPAQCRRVPKY